MTPGSRVVIACSGGADSTALVEFFAAACEPLALTLQVAHFDHGLRAESGADAAAVAAHAHRLQLPFFLQQADVGALAAIRKENLEAAGRRLRRQFLERIAAETGSSFIALGHHRDDQAETVLFRLLRGSGTSGLSGMAISSPPYIRPLLPFSRDQLRGWLAERGVVWREDQSNADVSRTRNRLRHQVLPLLASLQPGVAQKLVQQAARATIDEDFWDREVALWLRSHATSVTDEIRIPLGPLATLHAALRCRIWLQVLRQVNPETADELNQAHLEACDGLLAGRTQAGLDLPGLWVGRRYNQLLIRLAAPVVAADWSVQIPAVGSYPLPDGSTVQVSLAAVSRGEGGPVVEFDAESISFPLQLRNRRNGDRFHPAGGPGSRKLKEFLIDAKIPREERRCLPLLVAADVLWVAGVRRCDGYRVQSGKKVLRVELFAGGKSDKPLEKTEFSC